MGEGWNILERSGNMNKSYVDMRLSWMWAAGKLGLSNDGDTYICVCTCIIYNICMHIPSFWWHMKLACIHTHILTHVLSQCENCTAHLVLCCNPKMPETSLCPSSQTPPPLLLGPLRLLSPCRPQALNRLPAVFFIGCLHKPWPFTVTHKLLLM